VPASLRDGREVFDDHVHVRVADAAPRLPLPSKDSARHAADRHAWLQEQARARQALLDMVRQPVQLEFLDAGEGDDSDGDAPAAAAVAADDDAGSEPLSELGEILEYLRLEKERRTASKQQSARTDDTDALLDVAAKKRVVAPPPVPLAHGDTAALPSRAVSSAAGSRDASTAAPPPSVVVDGEVYMSRQRAELVSATLVEAQAEEARQHRALVGGIAAERLKAVSDQVRAAASQADGDDGDSSDGDGGGVADSDDDENWRSLRTRHRSTGLRVVDALTSAGVALAVGVSSTTGSGVEAADTTTRGGDSDVDSDDRIDSDEDEDELRKQWEWQEAQEAAHELKMREVR
jgi:hypothetical protein